MTAFLAQSGIEGMTTKVHVNCGLASALYDALRPHVDTALARFGALADGECELVVFAHTMKWDGTSAEELRHEIAHRTAGSKIGAIYLLDCSDKKQDLLPDLSQISQIVRVCCEGLDPEPSGAALVVRYSTDPSSAFETALEEVEILPLGDPQITERYAEKLLQEVAAHLPADGVEGLDEEQLDRARDVMELFDEEPSGRK